MAGSLAWSFRTIVPGIIFVQAVAILLAIRLIVFCGVADDIGQRESVVGRDEIHASGPVAGENVR